MVLVFHGFIDAAMDQRKPAIIAAKTYFSSTQHNQQQWKLH
jgi:hypothetical protein